MKDSSLTASSVIGPNAFVVTTIKFYPFGINASLNPRRCTERTRRANCEGAYLVGNKKGRGT